LPKRLAPGSPQAQQLPLELLPERIAFLGLVADVLVRRCDDQRKFVDQAIDIVEDRLRGPSELGECHGPSEDNPAPVGRQFRLSGAKHRHELIPFGPVFRSRLNRQASVMPQKLASQVTKVLASVELKISQWSR
jgi:hypothetical protein